MASCSSPSGTASAPSCSAAPMTSTSRAATCGRSIATFPSCTTLLLRGLPPGMRARRRDRDRHAARPRLRRAAAAAASGGVARREASRKQRRPRSSPSICWPPMARICANGRKHERRRALEQLLANAAPPLHLTPMTRDRALAAEWLSRFEGAGLDGVIAKPVDGCYEPGKRAMLKIKHARTADCVVAGFRWHKTGDGIVGSLLLGLYDEARHRCTTWASPRRSRWRRERRSRRSWRRCASARWRSIRGESGRSGRRTAARACRADRAAGARARICRGSRCGSSACAR